MALTTRGAGRADYSGRSTEDTLDALRRKFLGTQQMWSGSVVVRGFIGSIERLDRLGTMHYGERLGTVQWVGTVRHVVRLGTAHYVERTGTIGRVGTIAYLGTARVRSGSIAATIAAQDIMVGVDQQARYYAAIAYRDGDPIGPGSNWTGSWQAVDRYYSKMFVLRSGSAGGSVAFVGAMSGTGITGGTGTWQPYKRMGRGSYGTFPFTTPFEYVRPVWRQGGNARGSLHVFLGRQA